MVNKFLKLTLVFLMMAQINVKGEEKDNATEQFYLYVGAYTEGTEDGIYIYKFDAVDGDLTYSSTTKGVVNPSYLAINTKKNLLIAVNETGEYEGEKSGSVSSFEVHTGNGSLRQLSQVASGGGAPCYVSINKSGTLAYVANYLGGNVTVFPIMANGNLTPYTDLKQHSGSGPNENQKGPHAHAFVLDPKEDYILAADLGSNQSLTAAAPKTSTQ